MTAKELAAALSGCEYGMEISKEEEREAEEAGLVVVYGYADDSVELRGAIDAEVGAYDGATIFVTPAGLLEEPACDSAENCTCPYFKEKKKAAQAIEAVWGANGTPWTFTTDIPHETFTVFEDGETFCVGIVFKLEDVKNGD